MGGETVPVAEAPGGTGATGRPPSGVSRTWRALLNDRLKHENDAGEAPAPRLRVVSVNVMATPAPPSLGTVRLEMTRSAPIVIPEATELLPSSISAIASSPSAFAKR